MKLKKLGRKGNVLNATITVILAVVSIAVGLIIANSLFSSFDSTFSGVSGKIGEAYNSTKDMTGASFNLLPIAIIITGAVAVIAAVLMLAPRR